jgi:4-amino-4-deoxy-L-arabinose transferase-like glycosyltransferase
MIRKYSFRKFSFKSQLSSILVIISIILSHFIFKSKDLQTSLSFIFLIPIFVYFKFDGRIPIAYALLMLVLSAIVLAFYKNENLANQLSIYAYWLLVVGVICLTIEYIREQRSSKRKK